jgi:hypothetical protein
VGPVSNQEPPRLHLVPAPGETAGQSPDTPTQGAEGAALPNPPSCAYVSEGVREGIYGGLGAAAPPAPSAPDRCYWPDGDGALTCPNVAGAFAVCPVHLTAANPLIAELFKRWVGWFTGYPNDTATDPEES